MVALEQRTRLAAIRDLDRLFGKILDAQYISPRTTYNLCGDNR